MSTNSEGGSRVTSPEFRWYVASQAISTVGSMMGYTALYWLTLQISHGHAVILSILVASQFLPMLLFSRRAGNIVGRHRSVGVVMATQSLQAVGALALALPLLAGWMAVWYLWAACFVIGCVQAVDVPARQMFMLDMLGNSELWRGSSLYAAITGLAKIVGPGVAGVIIAASGEAAVFLADGVSFLLVVAVLIWRAAALGHAREPARDDKVKARRLRWLLDLPPGIQVAAAMAVLMGGFGIQFEVTNPLMAKTVLHLDSRGFGLIGTFMAVGGIAGNYYSSRRKDPKYFEFLAWALVFGVMESLAAIMPSVWAYDITMTVIGSTIQLFAISATVYVQQSASDTQRAHALSAYNSGFLGFVPAGAFVVAGLAAVAGTRWALMGPGLVITACTASALAFGLRRQADGRRVRPGVATSGTGEPPPRQAAARGSDASERPA